MLFSLGYSLLCHISFSPDHLNKKVIQNFSKILIIVCVSKVVTGNKLCVSKVVTGNKLCISELVTGNKLCISELVTGNKLCISELVTGNKLCLSELVTGNNNFIKLICYYQSIQCDSSGPIPLNWQLNQSPGQVTVSWD
jgi:hypothetical protein